MAGLLAQQADYLAFLFGLGLVTTAALCFSLCGRERRVPWLWLGLSALTQGIAEWLGLAGEEVPAQPAFRVLLPVLAVASCLFLAEFCRAGPISVRGRGPGRWILLPLLAVLGGLGWRGPQALLSTSGLLLLPLEALVAAWVFWLAARADRSKHGRWLGIVGASAAGLGLSALSLGALPEVNAWSAPAPGVLPLLLSAIAVIGVSGLSGYWAATWSHTPYPRHVRSRIRWSVGTGLALLLVLFLGWLGTQKLGEWENAEARDSLLARTLSVAASLDLKRVADVHATREGGHDPSHDVLRGHLERVREANSNCRNVYLVVMLEGQVAFCVDTGPENSPVLSPHGQPYPEASEELRALFAGAPAFVEGPLRNRWGLEISGLAPVHDLQTQRVLGVVGINMDAAALAPGVIRARLSGIVLTAGACILVLTFFLSFQRFADFAAQLADSERRYRTLLESSPNAIMLVDDAGRLLAVNRHGLETYGGTHCVSPEMPLAAVFSCPQAQPAAQIALAEVRAGRAAQFGVTCLKVPDRPRTWQVMLNPVRDENRVTGFVATAVDITELKRSEEVLADTVARLTAVNEIARAVASTLDQDRVMHIVLQEVDRAIPGDGCALIMCDPDGQHGRIVSAQGPSPDDPLLGPGAHVNLSSLQMSEVMYQGRQVYRPDMRSLTHPVFLRLVEMGILSSVSVPIVNDHLALGLLNVGRRGLDAFSEEEQTLLESLTPHIAAALNNARTYEQLRVARADLERAQEQMMRGERLRGIGEMAGGVAHDFNNLLGVILARTQVLLQPPLDDATAASLRMIETVARDGRETVGRIQQFVGKHSEEAMVVANLDQIVAEAVGMTAYRWKDEAEREGRSITVETELGAAPQVRVNPAEIREVLVNLLLNACEALPHGGRINVRSASARGWGSLEVADNGVGMDEATLAHATDLFFTTKGTSSTGLGLPVCQGIIQRHGGTMTVCGEAGRGTLITVALPLANGTPSLKAPPPVEETPPEGDLRVLLVDDDPMVLAAMREALDVVGYPALGAPDGPTAVAMARQQPFDVVISDLGMPGMSGWQVAEEIKRLAPETQVLILTGWGDTIESTRYVEETLTKPVELAKLREVMARAVGRKAA